MRHNRQKQSRKHLNYLSINFTIPLPPFILFDGTYLTEGLNTSVPIKDRIMNVLKTGGINKARWCVTRETVEEIKLLEEKKGGFGHILRFALDECDIIPPISPSTTPSLSIQNFVTTHSYTFVATQDPDLASVVRSTGKGSVFRISRTVTLLESLSNAVKNRAGKGERDKGKVEDDVREVLEGIKGKEREERRGGGGGEGRGRKRKKAKEANPLSCKKKGGEGKKKGGGEGEGKRKRKRKNKGGEGGEGER
ncbi:hypothetical protein TrCOL_g8211 [Triparma columacea]|uniref:UTP23 sensor motif region domain-containing protein n=1 Tax=Triparma columacea TaxID=722753 RepID=A0A9W7GDW2_9STRA|nr:hypothetical protein TrCOL_g8211 [Triparma columacea]